MPWQDFLVAAEGGVPARVPVALFVDDPFIAGAYGVNTLDCLLYPDRWLAAHLALAERFPEIVFLPGLWVNFGPATESSAFGTPVVWRHGQPPGLHSLDLPLDFWRGLPRPDPHSDGLMALALRRLWNLEQGGELPEPHRVRFAAARGPVTLAAQVVGGGRLLDALAHDPDAAFDLLDRVTETILRYLQAQMACLREPAGVILLDDAAGMLPPDAFRAQALPFLARIFAPFAGVIRLLHCAALPEALLPALRDLPLEVFHGAPLRPDRLRGALPPHVAIMASLPPQPDLVQAAPGQIEAAARSLIKAGGGARGGVILSTSGFLHPATPAASLDALARAAR